MKLRLFYRGFNSLAKIPTGYVGLSKNYSNFKSSTSNLEPNSNSISKTLTNTTIKKFSTDVASSVCWKCNFPKQETELFCAKCKALQDLPDVRLNYFQIIGVEKTYDLTSAELQSKYRRLQSSLHPDKFSNSSEREKELSENLSSLVNKAYDTLSHPLQRGLYMLKLNDVKIPEGTTNLNPEFLMEIMEKNEEVESASDDAVKILKLIEENREILNDFSRQVSAAFKTNDVELAKRILVKMKYYASIEARLKTLKQSLGIVE